MLKMMKRLAGCIREYKLPSLIAPVAVFGEVILEVLIPYLMADLIDLGIQQGNMEFISRTGVKLILLGLCSLCLGTISGTAASRAAAGFAKNLTHDMYHHIQDFSFANIDKFSSAGLVTRLTTDVSNVQMAYMIIIRGLVRSPAMIIFSLIMAFRVHPDMPWIFVAVLPLLATGIAVIFKKCIPLFEKLFKIYDKLNSVVQENLRGIRVVKSFVREDQELKKFKGVSFELYGVNIKAEYIMSMITPLMQFSSYACTLLISWIGARFVVNGSLSDGQLMTLLTYVMQILMSLMFFSMIIMMSSIATAAGKRITEVLDEVPDITNGDDPIKEITSGSIELCNASFAYPNCKDCLHDINIKIGSGQTVGIVGGTGSGKTSLMQLIPRLYDVTGGAVLVDNKDVRDIELGVLRKNVAMVLQKNILFSGSIRENLCWGKEDASYEELKSACDIAQASEFIENLPGKYNYMLEQGGTNLSGGQRQRLCIARALLAQPKILILDDSTSAVDTATEANIRMAFSTHFPDTTKLIIAQRITSVKDADIILFISEGSIKYAGTHEELLENSPLYREIYEAQTKDGDFDE